MKIEMEVFYHRDETSFNSGDVICTHLCEYVPFIRFNYENSIRITRVSNGYIVTYELNIKIDERDYQKNKLLTGKSLQDLMDDYITENHTVASVKFIS